MIACDLIVMYSNLNTHIQCVNNNSFCRSTLSPFTDHLLNECSPVSCTETFRLFDGRKPVAIFIQSVEEFFLFWIQSPMKSIKIKIKIYFVNVLNVLMNLNL